MVRLFIALFFLIIPSSAYSASYDGIMAVMENESQDAAGLELSYEAGLISIAESELDDTVDYSVSFAADPLADMDDGILRINELSFGVVLPDDDTTISASVPSGIRYDGRGAVISPSLSISHTFDWGHDDEKLKNLQTEALRMSVGRQYGTGKLSIRQNTISLMIEIISNEKSIEESREMLRDIDRDISDSISLGITTEGSLIYQELMLERKRSEDSLRISEREREELLLRYSALTGLSWDGLTDIPEPVFPEILSVISSSSVNEAEVEMLIAEENVLLEESQQNPKRLTIGGEAGGSAEIAEGLYPLTGTREDALKLGGTVGWEGNDWSLSATGGGTWDHDFSFTPSLAFYASWRSGTSESDDLRLRSLRNEARIREDDYRDALRSFEESREDLWGRMLSWERESAELEAEASYKRSLYEMALVKHERGLAAAEDVHDAEMELHLLDFDHDILLLQGLSLQAEAEALIL